MNEISLSNLRVWHHARNIRKTLALRSDSEHEQAIIRLVIVAIGAIYIFLSVGQNRRIDPEEIGTVAIALSCLLFSILLFLHIVMWPAASSLRRTIGMVHDNGIAAYMMYALGEYCAPFYIILLWVTFGNGFRFGRKYLFVSAFLGSTFFFLVLITTEYWKSHPTLGYGLLLGLIVLPLYVSSLLKKLTAALSRAEEANRAKNQFLANMSHEMRTPLSGILGMIDLIRGTTLTAEQEDYTNTIHASSQILLGLIEDVLDISKIEAGKISVEKREFDLHSLFKGTTAMVAQQAMGKGLAITTQISPRIPFLLRGDPLLIRQVLLNLLSNAVKFTEEGEVCLRVEQTRETTTNVLLRVVVKDTGIGIPPQAQGRIFDRFTQADDSITRRYGGTGLGTAIAKQLVELMGGEIGLESEPGKGSTFWFTLGLEKQPAVPISQGDGVGTLGGARILVVSSDGDSSFHLKNHLSSWGVNAAFVEKAAQAFSPLISAANDGVPFQIAIIVEKELDMDPYDLCKALRSVRTIQNIQLILVSKEEKEPDLSVATKHGFGAAVGASLDKTLLFNAVHFVRPAEEDESIPSLASRYRQKKEDEIRGLRILVAEDNATNQKVIAKILERAGHRPHLVDNGEQALDALEKGKFDLVLLDLHMPVMGGMETAKIFRFTRHGLPHPPLVALTADATEESRKACEEVGFEAFLTKPVEIKKLLELINSVVSAKKKSPAIAATPIPPTAGVLSTGKDGKNEAIDPVIFNELASLGTDEDFLENLVKIFLETGEQKIASIEKATLSGNYSSIPEIAHALKGSAGQIGASYLMELCNRYSHSSTAILMSEGSETVKILRKEFERVRAGLNEHIREAASKGASYGK